MSKLNRVCSKFSDSALLVVEKCSFTLSKLRFFNSARLDSENSKQAPNIKAQIVSIAILVTVVANTSCKFRKEKEIESKSSASENAEAKKQVENPIKPDKPVNENQEGQTGSEVDSKPVEVKDLKAEAGQVPTKPGGPVAGIVAIQDGNTVTELKINKPVIFRPTEWTRDTSVTSGCEIHMGILQASWTIGSRSAVDLPRFAGQECRDFNYSGTFTKAGKIIIQLDVVSAEGEQAHAEVTYDVAP